MIGSTVITTTESHKYKTQVTLTGQAKIAAAALNGEKVNITTAIVGDGGGSYYVPAADMTTLENEVWRGNIASKKINPKSANMIDVKVVLDGTVGGWTIREAGLVDEDGDLIVVCNLPDTEKAVILDGVASTLTLLLHVVFTNVDAVKFAVDASVDHVTAEDLDAALKGHDDSPGAHANLLPSIELVTLEHGLGARPQVLASLYKYGAGMGGAGEGPAGGDDAMQIPASAVYIQLICAPQRRLEDYLTREFATLHHGLGFRPLVMAGALQNGAGMNGAGEGPAGGTDMEQIPIRTVHHDSGSLTIYAAEDIAQPDAQKEIRRIGEREYTVTYRGDENRSVYIRLI